MGNLDITKLLGDESSNFIEIVDNSIVQLEREEFVKLANKSICQKGGKKIFIDGIFADAYRQYNSLIHANGAFYSPEGMIKSGTIRKEISESIFDFFPKDIASHTTSVLNALKDFAHEDTFDFSDKMVIPFANGDMDVKLCGAWTFHLDEKRPVPYRLAVNFVPFTSPRKTPHFDKWLHDLFTNDDILVLQEYIGYCLLPTTRCQKALLIIGEGEIGKSVIGSILKAICGKALTSPIDLKAFFTNRFSIAELENQLVFYEDDLTDAKLDDVGLFKKLVSSPMAITADRKNEQPFKFIPYCRFVMCGNHMLESSNDKSDGFYRRLLPLQAKPKDKTRKVIPYFENKVAAEAEGITQWALRGLKRLINNNWQFSISERTTAYVSEYRRETDHIPDFFADCLDKSEDGNFTNKELNSAYKNWCELNAITALNPKVIRKWLFVNGESIGIKQVASNNIIREGVRYRGYMGGSLRKEYLSFQSNIIL